MLEADEGGERAFRLMLELTVAHALSGVEAAAAAGPAGARPADVALVPMAIDALVSRDSGALEGLWGGC